MYLVVKLVKNVFFLTLCGIATPIEFESLGGKGRSKNWRKSICHEDSSVPLGAYLASADVASVKFSSASPRQLSPARLMEHDNFLADPVLAFIKAYRLKGDLVGLKQVVCSRFDSSSLGSAHRHLIMGFLQQ